MPNLKEKPTQNRIRKMFAKPSYRVFKTPGQDEWFIIDAENARLVANGERMAQLAGKFLRKPID